MLEISILYQPHSVADRHLETVRNLRMLHILCTNNEPGRSEALDWNEAAN